MRQSSLLDSFIKKNSNQTYYTESPDLSLRDKYRVKKVYVGLLTFGDLLEN